MQVGLSPRAAELVASRIATGQFDFESEVIEAALEALTREELQLEDVDWDHVNRMVAEAQESIAAGRARHIDDPEAYFAELRTDVLRRANERKRA